jgi:hypothetical protein
VDKTAIFIKVFHEEALVQSCCILDVTTSTCPKRAADTKVDAKVDAKVRQDLGKLHRI